MNPAAQSETAGKRTESVLPGRLPMILGQCAKSPKAEVRSPKSEVRKSAPQCGIGSACAFRVLLKLALLFTVCLLGTSRLAAQELVPNRPSDQRPTIDNPLAGWGTEYTNWVELSIGNFFVDGSRAAFQSRQQVPAGAFGGVESLHYEQPVGTNGLFQLDGRGIFDNHDYDISLDYRRDGLGYVRGGYREFREWYDVHGGFLPLGQVWVTPFDRDAAVDRGDAWFEAGLRRPDFPEITFRYDHQFRSGNKDSTSWGDLTTAAGTRNLVPSFLSLDERADLFQFDARQTINSTELGAGFRYEKISNSDKRFILRQPGQATERDVTQVERVETDLFNVHASSATRFNDQVLLTAGYAFTYIDTDPSGSRIYGSSFDALYDPTFRRGRPFDEGFLDLAGSATFHEHLFNLSLLVTPWENISLIPAVRISKQDESADSTFTSTDFSAIGVGTQTPDGGVNDRDYLDVAESLEIRYTGLTNWLWYARGEWSEDDGDLSQLQIATGDQLDEDADRFTQKYILGANWYPLRRLNLGAQYYHKIHKYNYENRLGGGPPDAYPGFIQSQNFETDDANFRLTLRPLNSLTLITRYDFQLSTIDTAGNSGGLGVAEVQSAEVTTHIISQSASWSPTARLFLQGNFNFVLDDTDTPANSTGGAAANRVLKSQNDYWDISALVGYAVSPKVDLQVQYLYFRANDYVDNSAFGMPYGAGAEENGVTATVAWKISKALRWMLKYGYFTNHDQLYGGHTDYRAHLVYSSLQYRF